MQTFKFKMYLFRRHNAFQNLPTHVQELIFQSLSGQDLLNCVGLCTTFYAMISNKEYFTDKIVLKTGKEAFRDYDKFQEYLNKTPRTYKHLKIESEDFVSLDFRHDKFDWKSLQISRVGFTNEVYLFIDQFAESIEELEFHNIRKVFDINNLVHAPEYPKLRSFTSNCVGFTGSFITWLYRFRLRPITNLTIDYDAFKFDIFEEVNGSTLTISNLRVTGVHNNYHITAVLNNFLVTQKDYLVELEMSQMNTKLLETVWNKLKIRKLTIGKRRHFDHHYKDELALEVNSSIEELVLQNEEFPSHILDSMFIFSSNLTILRAVSIDEESLLYTRLSLRNLKFLYLDEYVGDPNDDRFLKYFKNVNIKEIVTRAQHRMRMKKRWAPQTAFELFKRKFVFYICIDLFGGNPGTLYNPNIAT